MKQGYPQMYSEHNLEFSNLLRGACSPVSVPLGYLLLSRVRTAEQKLSRWLWGEVSIPVIVSSSYIRSSAFSLWAELQPLFSVGHSLGRIGLEPLGCVSYSAHQRSVTPSEKQEWGVPGLCCAKGGSAIHTSDSCLYRLARLFIQLPRSYHWKLFLIHSLNLPCCSLSLLTCLYVGCLQFLSSFQIPFLYQKTVYPVFSLFRFDCLG